MTKKIITLPFILACIFVWGLMLYFLLMTPYMADNFLFSRYMFPGYAAFMSGAPIERLEPMTLWTAVHQAIHMYSSWCGRFTGNLAVYLIFLLPYTAYAFLAATAFVVYVLLLHACIWGHRWRDTLNAGWVLGLSALLWAGLPSFGSAFFWISVGGSIALLGQALFLLPYRLALDPNASTSADSYPRCALFFLAGMAVASLDFPTSAAMPVASLACVAWLYFQQKAGTRRLPRMLLAGALGVCLGAAFTLLAPGNAERMRLSSDQGLQAYLASSWGERIASYFLNLPQAALMQGVPLVLLLWGCWSLYQYHGKNWWRHLPPAAFLFLLPAAATHGAYLFTFWPPARAFATTAVQLIVAAGIVAWTALPTANPGALRVFRKLRAVLCIFCIISLAQEVWAFYQVDQDIAAREVVFHAHKGGDARVPALTVRGNRYMVLGSDLQDIDTDPQHWVNRAVAAWYGLKSVAITMSPPRLLHPSSGSDFSTQVGLTQDGTILHARYQGSAEGLHPESLYVYYYGAPGLLSKLPQYAADPIFRWLEKGKDGDLRLLLVPILLARADIKLRWNADATAQGKTKLWGLFPLSGDVWLVRPGEQKISFDIMTLHESPILTP